MKCSDCDSPYIIGVNGKVSDMCQVVFQHDESVGYVPRDIGIGGGDYLDFDYCAACGKIQGKFPLIVSQVKASIEREKS